MFGVAFLLNTVKKVRLSYQHLPSRQQHRVMVITVSFLKEAGHKWYLRNFGN